MTMIELQTPSLNGGIPIHPQTPHGPVHFSVNRSRGPVHHSKMRMSGRTAKASFCTHHSNLTPFQFVAVVTAFGYLLCMATMLGLQCAYHCTSAFSLDPKCTAFFAMTPLSTCNLDKIIFTICFLIALGVVAFIVIGLIFQWNIVLLVHAICCLAFALGMSGICVLYIINANDFIKYWSFWRALLTQIGAVTLMLISGVTSYIALKRN
uniref:MARVEL domain-containing protein n=1 Tax=Steinernema glaseri TaxID=37863 RepID=A0A1I7YK70_9BILA